MNRLSAFFPSPVTRKGMVKDCLLAWANNTGEIVMELKAETDVETGRPFKNPSSPFRQ